MNLIVGLVGASLVFLVVLGITAFITNNLVDALPGRYQLIGYSACMLLAIAAGWSSFGASK